LTVATICAGELHGYEFPDVLLNDGRGDGPALGKDGVGDAFHRGACQSIDPSRLRRPISLPR
jgi:hypothetical protein